MNKNILLAAKIIKLLKKELGNDISPYEVENWAEKHLTNHTNLLKTGCFKDFEEED